MTSELPESLQELLDGFWSGDRVALARAISLVEGRREGFQDLLHAVYRRGPRAERLGITGPPGVGKSTLTAALAEAYRRRGEEVAVVAVDPTSPFSGGALLGDRIRMNQSATDGGIFIRSMASRGSPGGLATTTREVVALMDAFGFERIVVETVGVGQTQFQIADVADTVVLVLVPESGDTVQAMKAGLMELADVVAVNKADRPGADQLVREILQVVELRPDAAEGPRVVPIVARTGEGVAELMEAVRVHRTRLVESGTLESRRRKRAERHVREILERELEQAVRADPGIRERIATALPEIVAGRETPYSVAVELLSGLLGGA